MFVGLLSICALFLASGVPALARRRIRALPVPPKVSASQPSSTVKALATNSSIPPYDTWYYFNQLVDHNNPSAGTFVQRYYHTWEYYELGGQLFFLFHDIENTFAI